MSAFVVVLHFDGSPVDLGMTRDLGSIVAYRGPDAQGELKFPGVAVVHHMMRVTRSCAIDSQPLVSDGGQNVLVSDVRLDQRMALVSKLRDCGVEVSADSPNSRLLLEAFSIWGDSALDRIRGDYAFAIIDRKRGRLVAAVDPFGLRTLYYGVFAHGLVVSNDPLPIMAHPAVDLVLDRTALADFLLTGRVTAIDRTQTPFRNIRQLAGGHLLSVDLNSGHTDVRRFWSFPMQDKAIYYRSLADYGEHFRAVLKEAVGDRIDAPSVVAPMSGGMDSTTVVAMAAEILRAGGGGCDFTAVTAVQSESDPEGLLAAEVCRMHGISHRVIESRPGRPLASWRCPPFPATNFFELYENNQRVSAELGRLSINASSADYALCPEHFSVLGQLRAAGLWDTWRALKLVKSQYGFRPRLGTGLYSRLKGGNTLNPTMRPPYPFPGWLSESAVRDLGLRERWNAHWSYWPSPSHRLRPTAHRMITGRDRLSMHFLGWPLTFAPPVPADPFLDMRVIEFLWSLPPLPWFYDKHLTRTAMKGRLPDSVVHRRKTPAGRWLPAVGDSNLGFTWQPGSILREVTEESKLPDLNSGLAKAVDFHPMFLQKWLGSFEVALRERVGRNVQLSVF